ncbi:MBL fold metallo-hydrolase [uncultured Odoribacter sp.]|uniref:MBL fold metallo-hydrolase n=1 Tax=uncultured Odoribacter sp. TaxID=876416 RepID=UPI002601B2F1|nr:MBL fold metallo-hydrolase [uncultured Odoribacter sp.]
MKITVLAIAALSVSVVSLQAQSVYNEKGQAAPPPTQPFGAEAFEPTDHTVIRWLGNAGFLVNSRGTCLMVDPMLKGFDMPVLIESPILPKDVPHLDAVLVTHCDNDHYSIPTCTEMAPACRQYHSTRYVDTLMQKQGLPSFGHGIGETFRVGPVSVTLTPAFHTWQNEMEEFRKVREYKMEDYCGFLLDTPDGLIWAPGDSRFLPEFLELPAPDVIFFDFSDDSWHIGLEGAVKIANAYPDAQLLLSHWGTVDAPGMKPFNPDPRSLEGLITNPERIHVLAPGEPFTLNGGVHKGKKAKTADQELGNLVFERGKEAVSEHYTGRIYISGVIYKPDYDVNHLIFEAGSHNDWHIHPDADQVMLEGEGYYQEEGKPKQLVRKGDVVNTPANVKHWHGATPGSRLVHLSITDRTDKGHIRWMEAVTAEAYRKPINE